MKRILAVFFSLASALLSAQQKITFWTDMDSELLAEKLVDMMTDEELLSQVLMFGWAGQEPSDLLNAWVTQRGLGSVKVFGWNTDDTNKVAKSVRMLQKRAQDRPLQIPLFVATDQEGGWIRHVKGATSDTPGNMAIGASGYPIDAWYSGYYINKEIKALGINMNFAPTVDIYTDLDSTVIGPRSFGSEPQDVGILGEAFAAGSAAAGVIATAKHFPGHGDTSLDSHGRLPQIDISIQTLNDRELVPFNYLIESGIPAIMSAHLSFPQIEKDGTPASLSHRFLTDILRTQLGYKGLIITDDMQMNGATLFAGSFHKAVTMAIQAGNDIVISSKTANLNDFMWTKNLELIKSDEDFKAIVKNAARHVVLAKLNYFKSDNHAPLYPDESKLAEQIPDKEGQKFFLEQACRSISSLKKGSVPYKAKENEKVLLCGPFTAFFNEGKKRFSEADTFYFSYTLKEDESNYGTWNADGLEWTARRYDTIVILVYDRHTASIARRLKNSKKRVIVFSIMSPVFVLNDFDWADTILCGYSYSDYSFAALFGALNGEFEIRGTVPLNR